MKLFMLISAILIGPLHGQAPTASLIELIATPQKFDGKIVRFHGVLNIGFESNAMYLSKDHWENTVTSCGIWLHIPPELAAERKWGNGKYFLIEGTFDASDRGHMGLWMGALSKITLLTVHEIVKPR